MIIFCLNAIPLARLLAAHLLIHPLLDRYFILIVFFSAHGGSDGEESACNAEDPGLIPGLGRSPGEGNGNPL